MTAVLFGSISSLVDSSELQRESYNAAFAEHGLDWTWSQEEYAALLTSSGGADRLAEYAKERGDEVDATAVHETKSRIFQERLASAGLPPRPGVVDVVSQAKEAGLKVGLVTTTTPENVEALLSALSPDVSRGDFDVVIDLTQVEQRKPDGEAYSLALRELGEQAGDCVAIEDNVGGVAAASAAGVAVVAFPNTNTSAHDFSQASTTVDALDLASLRSQL